MTRKKITLTVSSIFSGGKPAKLVILTILLEVVIKRFFSLICYLW